MKIGIHNEPDGGGLGGSEVSVAVLAAALARDHEVEILHNRPTMTGDSLSQFADVDLSGVRLKLVDSHAPVGMARNLLELYRTERNEQKKLSETYDVFITFTHGVPPYCAARTGVLMVLFPFFDFNSDEILIKNHPNSGKSFIKIQLRSIWRKWAWRSRFRNYRDKVAISEFTNHWTKRRWNVDCQVIFPPVDVEIELGEKTNRILSVGRFALYGHGKKQIEMLQTFNRLRSSGFVEWQYDCAGGCGVSEEEQVFLGKVKDLGAEYQANIIANISREQLKKLYRQAKIFWHATGMDVDENLQPELTEHFGITTVEAMAAGCVPVVINKGGQTEIVEHGVSGFLWNTVEEWQDYTVQLMQDDALFQKMSIAARERSRTFSRESYINRFNLLLSPYLKV